MTPQLEKLGFKQFDDAEHPQLCYENSTGRYILNAIEVETGWWMVLWHMGSDGIYSKLNIGLFKRHQDLYIIIQILKRL